METFRAVKSNTCRSCLRVGINDSSIVCRHIALCDDSFVTDCKLTSEIGIFHKISKLIVVHLTEISIDGEWLFEVGWY